MPELQREVCWKNTDGEKLMLASNLRTESRLLSDNEVSISLLVFDFGGIFCSCKTVWFSILHSLILSGRILNGKVRKKTVGGAFTGLFPMKN